MIIDLLLITFIICSIIDVSGIMNSLKLWVIRTKKGKIIPIFDRKPFNCSTCMTWWIGLLYLFVNTKLDIPNIALVMLMSVMAEHVTQLIRLVKDIVGTTINKIGYFVYEINKIEAD